MEQVGTYVALLRGINVGGKHIVPMEQLAEIFTDAKCGNVRTYIQSGNVVFTASPKVAKALAARVAKNIEERFGFSVPVVLRNREELAQVARRCRQVSRSQSLDTRQVSRLRQRNLSAHA